MWNFTDESLSEIALLPAANMTQEAITGKTATHRILPPFCCTWISNIFFSLHTILILHLK
jgi:hypothetical protein